MLCEVVVMVTMFFPHCRVLMANISEDMVSDDLDCMKFLLSTTLPREKTGKAEVCFFFRH